MHFEIGIITEKQSESVQTAIDVLESSLFCVFKNLEKKARKTIAKTEIKELNGRKKDSFEMSSASLKKSIIENLETFLKSNLSIPSLFKDPNVSFGKLSAIFFAPLDSSWELYISSKFICDFP